MNAIRERFGAVAGAILCMGLLAGGCSTVETGVEYSGAHPLIRFSTTGIRFRDEYVTPEQAVERLYTARIKKLIQAVVVGRDGDGGICTGDMRHGTGNFRVEVSWEPGLLGDILDFAL